MLENLNYAERQFMDDLIEFSKGLIIKNQKRADEAETLESAKAAHEYTLAYSKKDSFQSYVSYTRQEMIAVGMRDEYEIQASLTNPGLIPEKYHDLLLKKRRESILNNYEEMNNYYRMLNGLPDLGVEPLRASNGKYVTELTNTEYSNFARRELDDMKAKNPDLEYLNFLGTKKISIYNARTSRPFYILNYEKYIFEEDRAKKFIELYYETLVYTTSVVYSDAFKQYDYYDNFVTLLMVFMTMQKFISEQFSYVIRKDFYDLQSIKDTFASYGLPFFEEIPIKYQRRIVKNINQLLKYKGTNRVLIDIVNIFGFTNVELFKYYLVKDFKRDLNNDILIDYENPRESYELKFAQIPLDETDISSALRTDFLYQTYEEVVNDDPFWGNDGSEESEDDVDEFKNQLLDAEFNYINTKYMSMNTMFDMSQANLEACYFFDLINKLEDRKLMDDMFYVNNQVKKSGNSMTVFSTVTAIFYLLFKRFGYDDNIIYTPSAIGTVCGFNFDGDMDELLNIIKKKSRVNDLEGYDKSYNVGGLTEQELRILDDPSDVRQKQQMVELYFRNRDYSNLLREKLVKSNDIQEFRALKAIYDYNMFSESIKDLYAQGDQDVYKTYSDYLEENDIELLDYCVLNSQTHEMTMKTLDNLISSLESYFNSEEFQYLFDSLSNVSGDLVKQYLRKIVNVFKAYTVELTKINVYYVFNDKYLNMIKMFSFTQKKMQNMIADAALKDSFDEATLNSLNVAMEKRFTELQESVLRMKHMTLSDLNINIIQDKVNKIEEIVTKSDSILRDLLDVMTRIVDFTKDEKTNILVEKNIHKIVNVTKNDEIPYDEYFKMIIDQILASSMGMDDYTKRLVTLKRDGNIDFTLNMDTLAKKIEEDVISLERIDSLNKQLNVSIKQTLGELVGLEGYAKKEVILHRLEKDLELKQSLNILLIKQLQRMRLDFKETLDNTLLFMDADLLFGGHESLTIRSKENNMEDRSIKFQESFQILY